MSASKKLEETNSEAPTKPAEENPPVKQSTVRVTQLTKTASEEQSKTKANTTTR